MQCVCTEHIEHWTLSLSVYTLYALGTMYTYITYLHTMNACMLCTYQLFAPLYLPLGLYVEKTRGFESVMNERCAPGMGNLTQPMFDPLTIDLFLVNE